MADKTGAARLRQAIGNQSAAGEACFALPIGEAYAICDEVDDELARVSWAQGVHAPVDADGEVVTLTTKVMYGDDGSAMTIRSLTCYTDGEMWRAETTSPKVAGFTNVSLLHLHSPDSWERLEEDVARCDDKLISCAYYNRVLGECDGCPSDGPEYCGSKIMHDILRRAKALAGRGAKASAPQPLPHGVKEADDD